MSTIDIVDRGLEYRLVNSWQSTVSYCQIVAYYWVNYIKVDKIDIVDKVDKGLACERLFNYIKGSVVWANQQLTEYIWAVESKNQPYGEIY